MLFFTRLLSPRSTGRITVSTSIASMLPTLIEQHDDLSLNQVR
jgi:hypothetical protein